MSIYVLLDSAGAIINRVVITDIAEWLVPEDHTLAPDAGYEIGGKIVGGNYTPPAPIEAPITLAPVSVSPRQARLALLGAGLLDQVEGAVQANGQATQITWDYAIAINRDDPLIAAVGAALQLTSEQVDNLFSQAALL